MKQRKSFGLKKGLILVGTLAMFSLATGANGYESKSSRENRVRVDVRPVSLTPSQPAKFEVRMNTHSGSLSQDMVAVSTLKDDQGRHYDPVSWQGSPPGGHHRRGVLEFPALEGNPRTVTLIIRNIADVPERKFEWRMKL